jgi:hypothetical protein
MLAGAMAVSTGVGEAGESCVGLDTALLNNLNFIAEQRRNPDALSEARIANRQAVVDLIEQRREVAGCTERVVAGQAPLATLPATRKPGATPGSVVPLHPPSASAVPASRGEQVCLGSTVTLSGENGPPAASSSQFPAGTLLRVTNLDNSTSITVEVTGRSGSCVLLNDAAFEQIREPGKLLVRRARVERIG